MKWRFGDESCVLMNTRAKNMEVLYDRDVDGDYANLVMGWTCINQSNPYYNQPFYFYIRNDCIAIWTSGFSKYIPWQSW